MAIIGAHTRRAVLHAAMMRQTYATRKPLDFLGENFVAQLSLCGTKAVRQGTARSRLSFCPILEQSKTLQHEEQRRVGFSTWDSLRPIV